MKKITFLLIFIIAQMYLFGQDNQNMTLHSVTILTEAIKTDLQYMFNNFMDGTIYYNDNSAYKAKLNYNFLTDEIHFIDENDKVMAAANVDNIKAVSIANITLIHNVKGFFELVENGDFSLLFKWKCKILEVGKPGAYGINNNTSKVEQFDNLPNRVEKLDVVTNTKVYVEIIPYLNKNNKFIMANSAKKFTKAFKHNTEISKFIADNPINFKSEDDLIKLTKFCNSLK
jgi:hypothetical protein